MPLITVATAAVTAVLPLEKVPVVLTVGETCARIGIGTWRIFGIRRELPERDRERGQDRVLPTARHAAVVRRALQLDRQGRRRGGRGKGRADVATAQGRAQRRRCPRAAPGSMLSVLAAVVVTTRRSARTEPGCQDHVRVLLRPRAIPVFSSASTVANRDAAEHGHHLPGVFAHLKRTIRLGWSPGCPGKVRNTAVGVDRRPPRNASLAPSGASVCCTGPLPLGRGRDLCPGRRISHVQQVRRIAREHLRHVDVGDAHASAPVAHGPARSSTGVQAVDLQQRLAAERAVCASPPEVAI